MTKNEIIKSLIKAADYIENITYDSYYGANDDEINYINAMREAAEMIESLTTELEQVKYERDLWALKTQTAINDLHRYPLCKLCANDPANKLYKFERDDHPDDHPCNGCDFSNHWQWRGLYPKYINKEN